MPRVERKVTPLTATQRAVLNAVVDELGYNFDNSKPNIKLIAQAVGWKDWYSIPSVLWILRDKGYLRSVGHSQRRPESWVVVEEAYDRLPLGDDHMAG